MFGFFKSPTYSDPQLGELRRSRGLWRGTIPLAGATVPLAISGSRAAPDPEGLTLARSVTASFESWRASMAEAMFEHYEPYAEAVAAGEEDPPASGLPPIARAADVWPHVTPEFVGVTPLDGTWTVEIGLRVAWDEEHTLGAQFQGGRLAGLNGSVLPP